MIVIPSAKNPSKSSNLVIFGPWDIHWHMESCFQRFGWVFKATRGVKTELVPKKSYFCWNHKVKSAISSTAIKHPKTPIFLNVLAIFQTNLVKRMGKALVPAVPRLFSHLGHANQVLWRRSKSKVLSSQWKKLMQAIFCSGKWLRRTFYQEGSCI